MVPRAEGVFQHVVMQLGAGLNVATGSSSASFRTPVLGVESTRRQCAHSDGKRKPMVLGLEQLKAFFVSIPSESMT